MGDQPVDNVAPTLTRAHYTRLRWYFGHDKGGGSNADAKDLDLCALGLTERVVRSEVVMFKITQAGVVELHAEKQREIERRKPHHTLGGQLAQWLRDQGRATWENIEFRVERDSHGQIATDFVRPDVFSVKSTLVVDEIRPLVHEIKVSRADFLADVAKPEKRGAYGRIAEGVVYVAPAGIVRANECPPECGLVELTDQGFVVVQNLPRKRNRVELQAATFMNMIIKPGSFNPA